MDVCLVWFLVLLVFFFFCICVEGVLWFAHAIICLFIYVGFLKSECLLFDLADFHVVDLI